MPETDTPTPTTAELQAAFTQARAELTAYVSAIEAAHREQHPDPIGPDGRARWNERQALQRTAAWTEEEHAELQRLREVERDAVLALTRARDGGGE